MRMSNMPAPIGRASSLQLAYRKQVDHQLRWDMAESKNHCYEFPRPSVTVDIILMATEPRPRVLLIKRKAEPFAGKWAFPGGFVDEGESLAAAAKRELKEETSLSVEELAQLQTFGDPGRDPRGWTVSVVYFARVDPK